MLLRAAKSRSKLEDPEQVKLKQKAKEMQRAELEEARQREANETALQAIGFKKKPRLDFNPSSSNSFNTSTSYPFASPFSFSSNKPPVSIFLKFRFWFCSFYLSNSVLFFYLSNSVQFFYLSILVQFFDDFLFFRSGEWNEYVWEMFCFWWNKKDWLPSHRSCTKRTPSDAHEEEEELTEWPADHFLVQSIHQVMLMRKKRRADWVTCGSANRVIVGFVSIATCPSTGADCLAERKELISHSFEKWKIVPLMNHSFFISLIHSPFILSFCWQCHHHVTEYIVLKKEIKYKHH